MVADLGEIDDIDRLVETAIVEFDHLNILMNNATVWPMEESMLFANLEDYENTMDVNVRSQFYAAKLVAKHLIESDIEGSIINISSQTGDRRTGNRGLYGISNTSVNGLTWRMAGELAEHGIRINAVSTDLTLSSQVKLEAKLEGEKTNQSTEEVLERGASKIPLGRLGTPEDIADAILYLASNRASYIIGTILRIADGGNLN